MSEKIIVLKFGGSVLTTEDDLPLAVHEIYRHWRRGSKVVAVVSAIGQTTDELLERAQRYGANVNAKAVASLVSTGEATSAALLALALGRSGVSAKLLSPEQAGIQTTENILDAELITADANYIRKELEDSVLVLSGFAGVNSSGDTTLLGRGGSDYTALFVARELNSQCVLIKDVDGLYESDPAKGRSRRYATASYSTTERRGRGLVQNKALRFAEDNELQFEIASFGGITSTVIGDHRDTFHSEAPLKRPIRVALLGCGVVGGGVYQRLSEMPKLFEITGVANLDPQKALTAGIYKSHIASDPKALIEADCDIVIELIGGVDSAKDLVEHALESKRHVITANKSLLAAHGESLRVLAETHGVTLRYSASVGGALPALEAAFDASETGVAESVEGIINGTCNFICDQLAAGSDFSSAVKLAQAEGFAESDPTLDLNGTDAAQKIVLLARETFGVSIPLSSVNRKGIDNLNSDDVLAAARSGQAIRLIAECRRTDSGVSASVKPVILPISHPFAQTKGAENCLLFTAKDGSSTLLRGRGAGRHATTEAVMADLLDIHRATKFYTEAAQ